jgi:hypothetical protein
MDAPEWYADWRHEAFHQLMDKQDEWQIAFGIKDLPRWDYDVETETLTFSKDGVVKVIADIQVVGTTGSKDWLWGWANDHWPKNVVKDFEPVILFGEEHGIMELIYGHVENDDLNHLGWELTAVAVRILNAVGAYRPKSEDSAGALFLLIKSVRFAN